MSTIDPTVESVRDGVWHLYAYKLLDSVQGGTLIITTLNQDHLLGLIKRAREKSSVGWTEEELLTNLVNMDPHRVRVVRTYSAEDTEQNDQRDALLFADGEIRINGDVQIDRYEISIQRLAETDNLAQSIATQAKKHKEEREAKPKLDAKKILTALKTGAPVEEKPIEAKKIVSIEAVPYVPKAVKVSAKPMAAVQMIETPRQSVLDRTVKAVKKILTGDENDSH